MIGQKKELLDRARNGLRNPCTLFHDRASNAATESLLPVRAATCEALTSFTGTPADLLTQRALSKTLGLASGEHRFYVRLQYSL
jgi:hypothetical protein